MEQDDYHRLKILSIRIETPAATSFTLLPLDGWAPVYRSGQFVTLVFFSIHGEKRRSYSISSSPELGEALTITVKKIPNGEFSRLLVETAQADDILLCSGISGLFVLPVLENISRPLAFFAAGSGITPCYSLLKVCLHQSTELVYLFYSNRSRADTIFYHQLLQLEDEFPGRFRLRFYFSNIMDISQGRMSYTGLQEHFLHSETLAEAVFYVCGPFEYMRQVQLAIKTVFTAAIVIKENFSTLPRLIIPRPPDVQEHLVTISIHGRQHIIPVKYPDNILSAALKKNLMLPYSCRAGRCGSCVATCTRGKIWMAYNEVLMDDELSRGIILTCQSYPVDGDAEISFT